MTDEAAIIAKVQYLHGSHGCICGRYKREGIGALPGEISQFPKRYFRREARKRIVRSQPKP